VSSGVEHPSAVRVGPVFPAGVTVFAKGKTASTNADARALAAGGAPHLSLVWAEEQEGGRGRAGRVWRSPPGNVYWSLLLRPQSGWPDIGQLAHVTALAVHAAVRPHVPAPVPVTLKWPNDTLIGGQKVSGVLIEAGGVRAGADGPLAADWVVVGVGINVAHHPAGDVLYPTTSLAAAGSAADRDHVLTDLTVSFVALLDRWTAEGFAELRREYLARAHGLGERATVRLSADPSDAVSGVHEGLDESGRLLLRLDDGTTRAISAGDVFFHAPRAERIDRSP
jgi:BirA family transcriptional regulator, biotin operon repressor / biotin---[acetyl-CoA-carboxylase] ligase